MAPKNHDEIRRRRAKPAAGRLSIAQKGVLIAGVLALFGALGISPQQAPHIVAAVGGGTVLALLPLKILSARRERARRRERVEAILNGEREEEARDLEGIFPPTGEDPAFEIRQISPGRERGSGPDGPFAGRASDAILLTEVFPGEEEKPPGPREPSADRPLEEFRDRLAAVEERAGHLEGLLLGLEERVAALYERQPKPEEKVDLQSLLSRLEGNRNEGAGIAAGKSGAMETRA